MNNNSGIVIIGGGVAAQAACAKLRKEGFDGPITMFTREAVVPYERPLLSKGFLQGKKTADETLLQSPEDYQKQNIDVVLDDAVASIDFDAHELTTDSGKHHKFDKLLLVTGSSPVKLPVPGADLPGVHYLRSLASAKKLKQAVDEAHQIVIIGAGFIGAEVAASARTLGKDVHLIDPNAAPMERALGPELGNMFADIHKQHGVHLHMGRKVSELRGEGRVEEVELDDGTTIPCDMVVVGIGVRPEIGLVKGTSLEVDGAIRVSDTCETQMPGVFAAGDVTSWWNPRLERYFHIEHYTNAQEQGAAAALAMLGKPEPYNPIPYFWSDQFETSLESMGFIDPKYEVVYRRYPEENSLTAFFMQDDHVQGAVTINRRRDARRAKRLIEAQGPVDRDQLMDPDVDIREINKEQTASAGGS